MKNKGNRNMESKLVPSYLEKKKAKLDLGP